MMRRRIHRRLLPGEYEVKTMLIHEDPEFEAAATSGDFDIIVPVSIFVPENGDEPVFTAYNVVWDICEQYEKDHPDDLLNADAIRKLCREVVPIVNDMGYSVDLKGSRLIHDYRISGVNEQIERYAAKAEIITSETEIDGLECPLLHAPRPDEDDVCAVVIENGVVCACAAINDFSDDDSVEINVETAVNYRGRGFGTAATAALVRYLINSGETVAYNCAESNKASSGIAEKLGMTLLGKHFNIICYAGEIVDG